jgi:hypothetical protein
LALATTAQAQHFAWADQFSGQTGADSVQPSSVSVHSTGALYLTGTFGGTVDFDPGSNQALLAPSGAFAVKLDAAGALVWAGRLGGNSNVLGTAGAPDAAGNLLSVGLFEGTIDLDPGPALFNVTAAGTNDVFVSKLSSAGNFVWGKRLGGVSFDEAHGVAVDGSGSVIVVGHFAGASDQDPGPGTFHLTSAGIYDSFVTKLDAAGNLVWAKRLGGPGSSHTWAYAVALDAGGNIHVTGLFNGTADFDPGPGTVNLTPAGGSDIYVVKLDTAGNLVWARQFGGPAPSYFDDVAYGIAVDAGGNVFPVGGFKGTADFDPGTGVFNLTAVNTDAFIAKLDANGDFLWAKQLGGAGSMNEIAQDVGVDAAGDPHVVGYFNATADFDPGAGTLSLISKGGDDAFAVELAGASGALVSAVRMGGNCLSHTCECCTQGDDRATSVGVSPAGHTFTAAYFRGRADLDPGVDDWVLSSSGFGDDAWLSKLAPTPVAGRVPDGVTLPGTLLTAERVSDTQIILRWGDSCRATDENTEIYEGVLGDFTSHVPRYCLNGTGNARLATVSPGNRYYLVVPSNETGEGSYGVDGNGNERPPSASACRLQAIERCLP